MWRLPFAWVAIIGLLVSGTSAISRGDEAGILAGLIDRHVQARLESEGLTPTPQAEDAEFVRRVYLDLHGVVPTVDQTTRFLSDSDPDKREQLIKLLLSNPRYGDYFGDVWRRRLLSPLVSDQRVPAERFADWLATRFNENAGWDRIASELLTATGKLEENAAVTYLIEGRYPLSVTDLTDLSSRYFLGIRLNCAQCHDHPFVEWKRRDYWGMAAFFAQIQTPGRPKVVYRAGVKDDAKLTLASLQHADAIEGLQPVPPTFLSGPEFRADDDTPYRVALAQWVTARENPYFAKAMVNRLWWHFFGRGIVNPVDDMHAGNAPSHPELLDQMSQRFAESDFDLKLLCRAITHSRTYQQTSRPGDQREDADRLFARMSLKVLTPEQLYDSLVTILGPPSKRARIDNRLGAREEFRQFFAGDGDPDPLRYERGIPHLLRLMNSPQFADRNVEALAAHIQTETGAAEELAERLFLTILSRRPTTAETQLVVAQLADASAPRPVISQRIARALLLSSEFSLNH